MKQAKTARALTALPNIGKVTAAKLREISIGTAEEFLARDPYEVFAALLEKDPTLCRCALSGIVGAHRGLKWNLVMEEAVAEFSRRRPSHNWKDR